MPSKDAEVFPNANQLDDFTDLDSNKLQAREPSRNMKPQILSKRGAFDIVSEYVSRSVEEDREVSCGEDYMLSLFLVADDSEMRMPFESMGVCDLPDLKCDENAREQWKPRISHRINIYLARNRYPLSDMGNATNVDDNFCLPTEDLHKNDINLNSGGRPASPDHYLRAALEARPHRLSDVVNSAGPLACRSHDLPSTAYDSLGLPDVHELVHSTAVAGQSLIDNKGRVIPSTVDLIMSAAKIQSPVETDRSKYSPMNPTCIRRPSTKSSMRIQPGHRSQLTSSSHQSLQQKALSLAVQHPFLQFWEHDIQKDIGGAWKSRRNTYLSFHLEGCLDIGHSRDIDCSGTRTHKRRHLLCTVPGTKNVMNHTSLSSSAIDLQHTVSTEIAVQESIMCSLQPCLLGYRWPGDGKICKTASSDDEYESLLLWQ